MWFSLWGENAEMEDFDESEQVLWEKGDFIRIAESMRESGEAFVDRLGMKPGLRVLDLGCGDGTTAIPAAKRGAEVLGVDIARYLVEAGNRRGGRRAWATADFRKETRRICASWRIAHLTSS